LPFVTEEVWHWWQPGSVHRAPWPSTVELGEQTGADPAVLTASADVLALVRRAKTNEKRSMRSRVARLVVTAPPATLTAVGAARRDLIDAGGIDQLVFEEGPELDVVAVLAEEGSPA